MHFYRKAGRIVLAYGFFLYFCITVWRGHPARKAGKIAQIVEWYSQ